jgi:hypothetical protein
MLKNPAGFVLDSSKSSTYLRGYACGLFFGCGLAWDKARLGAPGLGG